MRRFDASKITHIVAGTAVVLIAALGACDSSRPLQPVEAGGAFIRVSGALDTSITGVATFDYRTESNGDSTVDIFLGSTQGTGGTSLIGGFTLSDPTPLATGLVRQGFASLHVAVGTVAVADVSGSTTCTVTGVSEGRLQGRIVLNGVIGVFTNGRFESKPLSARAIFDAIYNDQLFDSEVQTLDSAVLESRD